MDDTQSDRAGTKEAPSMTVAAERQRKYVLVPSCQQKPNVRVGQNHISMVFILFVDKEITKYTVIYGV